MVFLAAECGSAAQSIPRQIEAQLVKHRLARKRNISKAVESHRKPSKPANCGSNRRRGIASPVFESFL
jgi:hypothetical protein